MKPRRAHEVIDDVAARQHGIVTRGQLLEAGLPATLIDRHVANRVLHVIHRGVYRVGPVVSARALEMAAVLACNGGVVSHRSAAALWTLLPPHRPGDAIDITRMGSGQPGRRPGIRAHRYALVAEEMTLVDAIPVTTPARTLFDLTRCATPRELERALAAALRAMPNLGDEIRDTLSRHRHRRGIRRLRVLVDRPDAPAFTRSEAEEMLLDLIRDGGLPKPETNVVVQGHEVDCYWRKARLVVEVDGYAYHSSSRAFSRDRQRDVTLAAAGLQVLRLSWEQISGRRERTMVQLATVLARNGAL